MNTNVRSMFIAKNVIVKPVTKNTGKNGIKNGMEIELNNGSERTLGGILNVAELIEDKLWSHTTILGQTKSGKTTLGKVLYAALEGNRIFYNVQNDRDIYGLSDANVSSPGELLKAIYANKKRINYTPPPTESAEHIYGIYKVLIHFGQQVAKRAPPNSEFIWATLFVDEAHLVAPKHSGNDGLSLLTTRGAGLGVRCVSITQRPSLLSHTVLTQSPIYFIFFVAPTEQKWFKSYGINLSPFKTFLDYQKHRFIFYDGFRSIPCEAVKV